MTTRQSSLLIALIWICCCAIETRAFSVPRSVSLARSILDSSCPRQIQPSTLSANHQPSRLLASSSNAENDDSSDPSMEKKIQGRKKRVLAGYRLSSLGYSLSALALIVGHPQHVSFWLCNPRVVGPLLASGITSILATAAANDRLSSDTYKRMNLAMIHFGLCGGFVAATASTVASPRWLLLLLPFITTVNSIKGYGYGAKGWKLEGGMNAVKKDLANLIKNSFRTMLSIPSSLDSATYLALTWVVSVWTARRLSELFVQPAAGLASAVPQYALLALLSVVCFTLKDAADRDRLEGTTFCELRILLNLVASSLLGRYWKTIPYLWTANLFLAGFEAVRLIKKRG